MKKYAAYLIEDFLIDDDFVNWVLFPDIDSNRYWENVMTTNPKVVPLIEQARDILLRIQIKPHSKMPAGMKADLMANIKQYTRHTEVLLTKNRFANYKLAAWTVAASLLISIGAFLYFQFGEQQQDMYLITENVKENVNKKKITNTATIPLVVLLPDNSTIVLDPQGSIVYDEQGFLKDRVVHLTGEAFFEVERMPQMPFIVRTEHLETKVLGTSFRVSANRQNSAHRVTVNTGLVEVKSGNETLRVSANQEAIYEVNKNELIQEAMREQAPLSKEVVDELFTFQESPLEIVLDALADQYNIAIEIPEEGLAQRTITLSLGDLHLYEKLALICKAVEAKYQLVDGRIIILSN